MKWNFIEVVYTNYDWRGSFQFSIPDIIEFIMKLAHTPTSVHPVSVLNLVSTPKKYYTYGLSQNCHITPQNTQFIGRTGVIVLFEGPRA